MIGRYYFQSESKSGNITLAEFSTGPYEFT